MEEQIQIERKKEKIKNWLKDPHNLIFIGILLFAIIIRLYYFSITKSQPLWWDEADYLAYAKNLAGFNVSWIITAKHNSLYPFLAATIFKLGLTEQATKFILQVIPSILSVYLVYLISVEMYKDKRIALISSFLMATFWVHLFNTMRFHIDVIGLFAGFLAIYVFWKGYEKKEKIFSLNPKFAIPLTVILVTITYTIRRGYFLFGFFFLVYMLSTKNWKGLVKDKYNWVGLAIAAILLFLSEQFIFTSKISGVGQAYFHEELPINFLPLGVFSSYFTNLSTPWTSILLYLFWLGVFVLISSILLSLGYLKKTTNNKSRADLFNLLTIIITLALFIFVLRSPDSFGEPRWYFPLVLGSFICISRASLTIADYVRSYSKQIATIMLVAIIAFGGYYEIKHADSIIKSRIESFDSTREASIFLKEISSPEDWVITLGQPQIEFYSERKTVNPKTFADEDVNSPKHFESTLEKIRQSPQIKYLIISFSEPGHPEWMKKVQYANLNGQTVLAAWEIPFMETKIDFINQQQDIKQSGTYEDITFNLVEVKQDVFIYEIIRS
jgi:hypothetical protein